MLSDVVDWGDSSYTGQADAIREKVVQFQETLNALDQSINSLQITFQILSAYGEDSANDVADLLDEAYSKRDTAKNIASAINGFSSAANAVGYRMPAISVPSGLGMPWIPVALTVFAAGGVAVVFMTWGKDFTARVADVINRAVILSSNVDDQTKQRLLAARDAAEAARQRADAASGFGAQIGDVVKWLIIGGAAFFLFKGLMKNGH
jgi:hypothetical protein